MKITKERLTLEEGLQKEWIITNGIGGYSSSTIIGANTRKYHGLLMAALMPPARRFLILSKVDESIQIGEEFYDLYTNIGKNYIAKGYQYQQEFSKDIIPTFTYQVKDIQIIKKICMDYGKNTVGIFYQIKNGNEKMKFTLAPIMNYRDFHTVSQNHQFKIRQRMKQNKVKIVIDDYSYTPIYIHATQGIYIEHKDDTFFNMFYLEEEKRGFLAEENHAVVGRYEITCEPNEEKEISFVCSLEENIEYIDVKDLIQKEEKRMEKLFQKSELLENTKQTELIKAYLIASDNFVVNRPNFGLHTLIAGYPWFLDWGRDTLIALEGTVLIPKRYDIAREILMTMTRDIKSGLIPNGYSGYDNRPLYNSVDASLLLFEQIEKYILYTGDYQFVENRMYDHMKEIIKNYSHRIDVDNNAIYLCEDGLLSSGTEETQNTWMDAKYEGKAITPRNGKAVEINALWYNANKIMEALATKWEGKKEAKQYSKLAKQCQKSFLEKFYNKRRKCLYDVLGDSKLRPNQLFALSLTYPVINPKTEEASNIINVVEKKLLTPYGLKTLAKGEENYVEIYEGGPKKRDSSYHQGITWPWLLGLYYNSLKNIKQACKTKKDKQMWEEKIEKLVEKTTKTFQKEMMENGCIGGIAEIYDSKKPQLPKGTINQAWSVAEVFRIILRK